MTGSAFTILEPVPVACANVEPDRRCARRVGDSIGSMSSAARRSQELAAAEAIRKVAEPLRTVDKSLDPTPILQLVGSPDVIGLGEPTHGDAESMRLKHAVMRAVAGRGHRLLIAWERGVGNMRHIASFVAADQELPHGSRRWIYPWVYQEVDDLLLWVRDADRDRPGSVSLCGVDMDGPAPSAVLDELLAAVGSAGAAPLRLIRSNAAKFRDSPEDADRYQIMLGALADLASAAQGLSRPDRLLLDATAQWARFGLLSVAESRSASASKRSAAAEHRDKCMAKNLIEQRCIHKPDVAIFSAHNGHVCVHAPMAGWHLARAPGLDYVSVGVAFGGGCFNAGTARDGGGFDPELRLFDAEPPPRDSLEALLGQVGLPAFVVDLRPFRGTDHPLGHEMTLREVGLAGGAPQFKLRRSPAAMYDVLIWCASVTPATVLRRDGDFW